MSHRRQLKAVQENGDLFRINPNLDDTVTVGDLDYVGAIRFGLISGAGNMADFTGHHSLLTNQVARRKCAE